jgi:long-chain acyl-CoA synthetase
MLKVSIVRLVPKNKCLGRRPWDSKSKSFGAYVWEDYKTIHERRKNLGAGLKILHERVGVVDGKYGVGLFCNNRPEWQITGMRLASESKTV